MGAASSVMIQVGANASQAVSEFNRLNRAVGDHMTATQKVSNAVQKAAVPAGIALAAMGYAALDATKAAAEDAAAQEKLAGTLSRVTNASSDAIAAADDYIGKLSQQVGVADDELRPALGKLATATGDLTKAQDLLGTALDISAQTGKPLESVSTALAKAYAGNEGALKKLLPGIDEGILKSGNFAAIQKELARITGGAAQESANTAAGQFKRFQITLDETKEAIGAALLPILNALLPVLQSAANWAQENSDKLVVLGAIVGTVAGAIVAARIAMSVWNAVQEATRVVMAAITAAQWLFNAALAANPIGIVIVALAALAAAIYLAWEKSETFRNIITAVWDAMRPVADFIANVFIVYWHSLVAVFNAYKAVVETVIEVVGTIIGAFKKVGDWISDTFGPVWDGLKKAVSLVAGAFALVVDAAATVWDGLKAIKKWVDEHAGPVFGALADAVRIALKPIELMVDAIKWIIENASKLNPVGKTAKATGEAIRPKTSKELASSQTVYVDVSPGAQQWVDDESLYRALANLIARGDARNGGDALFA